MADAIRMRPVNKCTWIATRLAGIQFEVEVSYSWSISVINTRILHQNHFKAAQFAETTLLLPCRLDTLLSRYILLTFLFQSSLICSLLARLLILRTDRPPTLLRFRCQGNLLVSDVRSRDVCMRIKLFHIQEDIPRLRSVIGHRFEKLLFILDELCNHFKRQRSRQCRRSSELLYTCQSQRVLLWSKNFKWWRERVSYFLRLHILVVTYVTEKSGLASVKSIQTFNVW